MPKQHLRTSPVRARTHLVQARYERSWSQQQVADQIGTTTLNVSRWERGLTTPSPYFRQKLSTLFQKPLLELDLQTKEPSTIVALAPSPTPARAQFLLDPALPLLSSSPPFMGRDVLLTHIISRLLRTNVTALNGLPGIGKTTLALHVAYDERVRARFSDGILWANLGPTPNVQAILAHWGMLLGSREAEMKRLTDVQAAGKLVRNVIGTRRFLLILDDVWQLDAALACHVGGPTCGIVVTSRLPQIALAFSGQEAVAIEELDATQSLLLLHHLAPDAVQHAPELVQELLELAGGLPLALTLMGHFLRMHSYNGQPRRIRAALASLLSAPQRLHLEEVQALTYGVSAHRPHVISLQAMIATSDEQLETKAREMLRALSVFPAKPISFSEEAALAISGGGVESLDALSDAGLLESGGPSRYMLHQTIIDYGCLKRTDPAPLKRLVEYSVNFLERYQEDYIRLEQENVLLLSALDRAFSDGWHEEALRGVFAFSSFLLTRGLYERAEQLFTQALEIARGQADQPRQLVLFHLLAHMANNQGTYEQAHHYADSPCMG